MTRTLFTNCDAHQPVGERLFVCRRLLIGLYLLLHVPLKRRICNQPGKVFTCRCRVMATCYGNEIRGGEKADFLT